MAEVRFKADNVLGSVAATGVDKYLDMIETIRKRIETSVKRSNAQLLKTFAVMALDVAGPPSLGEYTPQWEPLSSKYLKWKQRRNMSLNFYSKKGDLRSTMMGLRANTVLGTPVATYGEAILVGNPDIDPTSFRRGANLQMQGRYRAGAMRDGQKVGGQWASGRDVFKKLPSYIRVYPFPNIEDLQNAEQVFGDDSRKIAAKLTNPKGRKLRPVFSEFLMWWMDTKTRTLAQKALKR